MNTSTETSNRRPDMPRGHREVTAREEHAIKRILVCIDSSPLSHTCLPHAVGLARSVGSALTILYVMQSPRDRSGAFPTDVLDWEMGRQEASGLLEGLRRETEQAIGQSVEARLEQGHPAERIADVAHEIDADLTVLGSYGEHGIAAWNLGSTVQQVLAVGRSSVFVVRSNVAPGQDVSFERILVPLDGSLRAEAVLPTAERIARTHGAELLLSFIAPEPVPSLVLGAPEDLATARELASRVEGSGKQYLGRLSEALARNGVPVRTIVVRSADEKQSLLELSQTERADLILLSAHGATCNAAQNFGSVTAHLLAHARVPLLVLQDLRGPELLAREEPHRSLPPPRSAHSEGA